MECALYFTVETGAVSDETLVISSTQDEPSALHSIKSELLTPGNLSLMCEKVENLYNTIYGDPAHLDYPQFSKFPDQLKPLIGKFKEIRSEIAKGSIVKNYGKIVYID